MILMIFLPEASLFFATYDLQGSVPIPAENWVSAIDVETSQIWAMTVAATMRILAISIHSQCAAVVRSFSVQSLKCVFIDDRLHLRHAFRQRPMDDHRLRQPGNPRTVRPARRVPEVRSGDRFGTMLKGFLYRDDEKAARLFAVDSGLVKQSGIADDLPGAAHPQREAMARDKKIKTNFGVHHQVSEVFDAVVAKPIRNREGLVVQYHDKARWIALGRQIEPAIGAAGGNEDKRAGCDERAANRVNVIDHLVGRTVVRTPVDFA